MNEDLHGIEDIIQALDRILSGIEENSYVTDIFKRYRDELESFHFLKRKRKLTKKEKLALRNLLTDVCGFIYVYSSRG